MIYSYDRDNLHIEDSYLIKSETKMDIFLTALSADPNVDCRVVHVRSISDLIEEWKAHNLLYDLHLFRTHTKDVDLDINGGRYQWIWKFLSWFY